MINYGWRRRPVVYFRFLISQLIFERRPPLPVGSFLDILGGRKKPEIAFKMFASFARNVIYTEVFPQPKWLIFGPIFGQFCGSFTWTTTGHGRGRGVVFDEIKKMK